jgi:hypothetical protein
MFQSLAVVRRQLRILDPAVREDVFIRLLGGGGLVARHHMQHEFQSRPPMLTTHLSA